VVLQPGVGYVELNEELKRRGTIVSLMCNAVCVLTGFDRHQVVPSGMFGHLRSRSEISLNHSS
jgi:hypothetical protein